MLFDAALKMFHYQLRMVRAALAVIQWIVEMVEGLRPPKKPANVMEWPISWVDPRLRVN